MVFSKNIISWYKINHRKLPWRETKNPYYILVSEFMLQQTKVCKTIKYYYNFIKKFPSLEKLAKSKEKDILKEWEGLGYYERAINLHSFSKRLKEKSIIFPKKYKELILYKGIGPYTGAAIASICFNEVIPAIDVNVIRVISRYLGIYTNIRSNVTKNILKIFLLKIIDKNHPGIFNQAIMDLGAILCTTKKTKCFFCPLKTSCFSFKNGTVYKFPIKNNIITKKNRFFYYIFINDQYKNICIHKRYKKDIWKGLYDFPLIEYNKKLTFQKIKENFYKKFRVKINTILYQKKHQLTHQNLYIQFLNCEILKKNKKKYFKNYFFISYKKIKEYPFPSPIVFFLKKMI
ncbi:A/G-specific adenine glycosylase [Blattabacterium cuenoti]|uniref:A/G-specific adenine glycosylase n=1 Tax=Blattabacterium cuenoti TaxID=1653831 RepID=UPI00163B9AB6|nr:A/G-specific adenine glycosylase [Blattabacterium cuenoti]